MGVEAGLLRGDDMIPTTSLDPIELEQVWKQFQVGANQGSLRDAIPALVKRVLGRSQDAVRDASGQFWALSDVSFRVKRGETLGIIGPNGAGKSTILKLLSRICKQTKGQVHVRGRLAALIEVGAGFHPDLTGRENIYLNGTIMGLKRKQIDTLFDSIVAFAELEKFLEMPVKRYSSGMNVRLGFAIAAHVNPEIMLIDEVLAVGDLSFQQKCFQRIAELKEQGTTIVFISHNMEAISRICDRVALLQGGRVISNADPATAIAEYRKESFRNHKQQQVWTPLGVNMADLSKDIEIVDIQLRNGGTEAQDTIETGQALHVDLTYRAKRSIRNPSVTVTIERVDGLICHEASTQASGLSWPSWDGQGVLRLRYPSLSLLPNAYLVNVAIYEGQNPVPLAKPSRPHYFYITSDHQTRGTVRLDHEWDLQGTV